MASHFLQQIIEGDLKSGKHKSVLTRFPPEPNGYLHIGHAKSVCLNFGLAKEFAGKCNLRFDDTNPTKEDVEYVEAIQRDIRWLGYEWDGLFHASDYFEKLYGFAQTLIRKGLAYVCDLSEEEFRTYRGTVTQAGKPSPYRERSVEENLDLFERMRKGEFEDGSRVLRAHIDMASPNMKMRDPPLYRIRRDAHHYRTGDTWKIYPMYDFAHCLSDAIEGVTHSICTLEFENNRELYDWIIDHADVPAKPRQYEFARLNVSHVITSKRGLLRLVTENVVEGWDDPRMPTIAGMRRRGYPAEALRKFCDDIGVARAANTVAFAQLEETIRQHLNPIVPRVMVVMDPLKVVIENVPEDHQESFAPKLMPHDESQSETREVPFSREIWIERSDFEEDPPKKFFRLAPGREVRLRWGYVIKCEKVVKDDTGRVVELRCTYDPNTGRGKAPEGRKVKGVIHWVSAKHAVPLRARLYAHLFSVESPGKERDLLEDINPDSLVDAAAYGEPYLAQAEAFSRFQFERQGYFMADPDSRPDKLVFNRTVSLRDTWGKKN